MAGASNLGDPKVVGDAAAQTFQFCDVPDPAPIRSLLNSIIECRDEMLRKVGIDMLAMGQRPHDGSQSQVCRVIHSGSPLAGSLS